jgi:hypothetical protein
MTMWLQQPWSTIYYSLMLLQLRASICFAEEQTCVAGQDGTCSNTKDQEALMVKPANGLVEIDWGETQVVEGELWQTSLQNIQATKIYMASVRTNDKLTNVVTECKSRNKLCSFWAAMGKIYRGWALGCARLDSRLGWANTYSWRSKQAKNRSLL